MYKVVEKFVNVITTGLIDLTQDSDSETVEAKFSHTHLPTAMSSDESPTDSDQSSR